MMTNIELANKLKNIAKNYKTLYVMGCFGAPMTATNKKRYTKNHSYNRQAARTAIISARILRIFILLHSCTEKFFKNARVRSCRGLEKNSRLGADSTITPPSMSTT